MECLSNLIGINHQCNNVTPISGLNLQDLPLVTIKAADAAATDENESGIQLLEQVIEYSQNAMVQDLRNSFKPFIRFGSIIENDRVGKYNEDLTGIALEAGMFKGIEIVIDEYPYLEFYISSIWLQLNAVITTNIRIYDVMTNTLLESIPITTIANRPTQVYVQNSYKSNKGKIHLFVCIDAGVAGTFETKIYSTLSACSKCTRTSWGNRYINFSGAEVSQLLQVLDANLTVSNNTNGLSIEYSLSCDADPVICNIANQLGWPLLHRAGFELMQRLKFNERYNSLIVIHAKDIAELGEQFKKEYYNSMEFIIQNMSLPQDICFSCPGMISKQIIIP